MLCAAEKLSQTDKVGARLDKRERQTEGERIRKMTMGKSANVAADVN